MKRRDTAMIVPYLKREYGSTKPGDPDLWLTQHEIPLKGVVSIGPNDTIPLHYEFLASRKQNPDHWRQWLHRGSPHLNLCCFSILTIDYLRVLMLLSRYTKMGIMSESSIL